MGGWAVAQSPIMVTTITLKRLIQRGYESLLSYYESVTPILNEPVSGGRAVSQPIAIGMQWSTRIGFRQINVRGAHHPLIQEGPSARLAVAGPSP